MGEKREERERKKNREEAKIETEKNHENFPRNFKLSPLFKVYVERMKREYNVSVDVGAPRVAYREAITKRAEFDWLHKKQSGGQGQYARVVGYLEPVQEREGKRRQEGLFVREAPDAARGLTLCRPPTSSSPARP